MVMTAVIALIGCDSGLVPHLIYDLPFLVRDCSILATAVLVRYQAMTRQPAGKHPMRTYS